MASVKERILDVVKDLPEDTTWDDAVYTLYMHAELEASKEAIAQGKVVTMEEYLKFTEGLEAEYEAKNINKD